MNMAKALDGIDWSCPRCNDCGEVLRHIGGSYYSCDNCEVDVDLDPPTPAQRRQMIKDYR